MASEDDSGQISPRTAIPRWIIAAAAAVLTVYLLYVLRGALTPVFFAFLIAYLLDPVVDRLEGRGLPRALAIVVLLILLLGGLGLFVLLVVPSVLGDIAEFSRELPGRVQALLADARPWLLAHGIEVPTTLEGALEQFHVDTREIAGRAVAPAGAVLGWLAGGTASVLSAAVGLLIVPVFAFYLLYDFDRIVVVTADLVPLRFRSLLRSVITEIDQMMSQFVRGQLTVMAILAALYSIGYSIVGVPLAVVIGVVAGALSFIPYVGGATALGLGLLMTVLAGDWWPAIVWVVVVYGVIQAAEGLLITPRIVGDKVGLSAVWVLFALMVGGEAFGFMGVLLAVPSAAVAKILVRRAMVYYRSTEFYRREGAVVTPAEEPLNGCDPARWVDGSNATDPADDASQGAEGEPPNVPLDVETPVDDDSQQTVDEDSSEKETPD